MVKMTGGNVKVIGASAFYGCHKLKTVKMNVNKLNSVGKNTWKAVHKKCKFTIYAKNKRFYNKAVKKIKTAGARNTKFSVIS